MGSDLEPRTFVLPVKPAVATAGLSRGVSGGGVSRDRVSESSLDTPTGEDIDSRAGFTGPALMRWPGERSDEQKDPVKEGMLSAKHRLAVEELSHVLECDSYTLGVCERLHMGGVCEELRKRWRCPVFDAPGGSGGGGAGCPGLVGRDSSGLELPYKSYTPLCQLGLDKVVGKW